MKSNRITVIIPVEGLENLKYCEDWIINSYICCNLKEAGIPIIGGPLLPKVDFTKGVLESYTKPSGARKFVWIPKGE